MLLETKRKYIFMLVTILLLLVYPLLRSIDLHGSTKLYTLMATIATLLALFIGILSLIHYHTNKSNQLFLLIGVGFFGTAFLDGYHVIVTSIFFSELFPSVLSSLITWSWIAPRIFLSMFLFWSYIHFRYMNNKIINERHFYTFVSISTLATFIFFAFVPLPSAYYPELLLYRPEELVPALFFSLALYGYIVKGSWKNDIFEYWLTLSLIVSVITQIVFMSFSEVLFDMEFDAATLLKIVSYLLVLIGLLKSIYQLVLREKIQRSELSNKTNELKESQSIAGLGSYTLNFHTEIWTSSDILDQLFGIDQYFNRSIDGWKNIIHPDDRIKLEHCLRNEAIKKGKPFDQEYRIIRQNDNLVCWMHCLGKLEFNSNGSPVKMVGTVQDITKKKDAEAYIENLAHFDQLTGLPNRLMLNDRVTYLLNMAQRNNEPLTVMFLDLDNFKNINDSLGHTIGDYVLIEMAKRIKETIRDVDTVARLGGDEFIMLFPDTDSHAAIHIATKLIEKISKASIVEHNELTITPSIGIAIYPNDGKDFETLLRNADTAMYRVKNSGRNNFHFFTQEMQLHLSRNLKLENALRHALKRNELELYYQPQISISNGRIIGAEALLRWHHPELGMISPAEFIPIAESSGQIIKIGEWVLRTAIEQTKEWMDSGFAPMIIAVNISAMQFRQKNLLTLVTDILAEVQLPNEYLELELTEAVTMHDPESVIDIMNKFHEQGIRMSIDDFGTGYSSLSYLKKFKVYKLKIDQSFIHDISDDPDDRSIVSAIIDMANNLGLQTIAEGVETAEQLAFLRLHGCREVQGYYFSKPLPSVEFEQFRHNHIEY